MLGFSPSLSRSLSISFAVIFSLIGAFAFSHRSNLLGSNVGTHGALHRFLFLILSLSIVCLLYRVVRTIIGEGGEKV